MSDDDTTASAADADSGHTGAEAIAEVTSLLHAVRDRVAAARAVPMSGSIMLHKKELLDELDRLAAAIPAAYDQAREILDRREEVIDEGRAEVVRLRAEAEQEHAELVRGQDVHKEAEVAAQQLVGSAEGEAQRTRGEVDAYVDRRLAQLEVTLARALNQVRTGREQLGEPAGEDARGAAARLLAQLGADDPDPS